MKLLRPLASHTFNDLKTNDSIRRELQTECILDRIDEYRRTWLLHVQRMPQNRMNPFKIIPLQSTRKENGWETEETLERAAVTLGTERAKWHNPWCLWWWWWRWRFCLSRIDYEIMWKKYLGAGQVSNDSAIRRMLFCMLDNLKIDCRKYLLLFHGKSGFTNASHYVKRTLPVLCYNFFEVGGCVR
jgi:hypothetical protein